MDASTIGRALPIGVRRGLAGRGALLCGVAVLAILVQAQLHSPIGIPGHRGLVWLTLLVAVLLFTSSPPATAAVGLTSAGLMAALGLGPQAAIPPAAAAVILATIASAGWVRHRPWLIAVLAAPVHLVALVMPLHRMLTAGAPMHSGMNSVIMLYLVFGLGAGLAGWMLARLWSRGVSERSNRL